ncbi:dUTP diphosphatase [Arthrobacter caoxuetaonis]|uniref:dUTP diphosphatase n=1 Tax=Arthrobacter caoxuetaonis TaxID=2886935 RepID=A0A9X1SEJ4_9MICC|nr:dUTP diphosphatase [Arthrobacter caoxuetaonis]MCC3299741.1 dUTP diphosphatase [Arthrobacter caoxuetaonis]USQ59357.1 dUTP diphosphatase [Arthrobacter caoxuetaonis]
MSNTKVLIRKLEEDAVIPSIATPGDAGADLYSVAGGTIPAGSWAAVGTGIALELEPGTVGLVHPRSGLAAKKGITVLNAPGTIDAGYRGEVKVLLSNTSDTDFVYEAGERIAQLVIQEFLTPVFEEADTLSSSVRGEGGFGHTGTK